MNRGREFVDRIEKENRDSNPMPFKCNEQECRVVVILVGHQTKQIIVSALEMEDAPLGPLLSGLTSLY